jgi:hypothetical protein
MVTVLSGTLRLGMGATVDSTKTTAIPAGGFFAVEPGMPHYATVEDDVTLQLSAVGPFAITYVNPADDPRNKK